MPDPRAHGDMGAALPSAQPSVRIPDTHDTPTSGAASRDGCWVDNLGLSSVGPRALPAVAPPVRVWRPPAAWRPIAPC